MRKLIAAMFCAWLTASPVVAQIPDRDQPLVNQPAPPPLPPAPEQITPPAKALPPALRTSRPEEVTATTPAPIELTLPNQIHVVVDATPIVDPTEDDKPPADASTQWWIARFFERWLWLIAFFFVAGASALFGWRDSSHAVVLEDATNQAKSFRDLIRQGNSAASEDLDKLRYDINHEIDKHRRSWRQGFFWVMAAVGLLTLLLLAWLPNVTFDFKVAPFKDGAWRVLNSDFATAFAATWIATLYVWGSQNQRKREADRNFRIVTNEAEAIAQAEKRKAESQMREADRKAYEKYTDTFGDLAGLELPHPWSKPSSHEGDEEMIGKFRHVEANAKLLGLKTKLLRDAKRDKIDEETRRLETLLRSTSLLRWTLDLGSFVRRLRDDKSIPKEDLDWADLATALESREPDESVREEIRKLADKLEQRANESRPA